MSRAAAVAALRLRGHARREGPPAPTPARPTLARRLLAWLGLG